MQRGSIEIPVFIVVISDGQRQWQMDGGTGSKSYFAGRLKGVARCAEVPRGVGVPSQGYDPEGAPIRVLYKNRSLPLALDVRKFNGCPPWAPLTRSS